MKNIVSKMLSFGLIAMLAASIIPMNVFAEEGEEAESEPSTSIRLMPVSKILQISSDKTYDESFEVFNDGKNEIKVEVYAAPYSYIYSEEQDVYQLGFSNENNFTQISRWIKFDDGSGNYVDKPVFTVQPEGSVKINFRVSTPNNIPAGGQYGVIFAHTLNGAASSTGIRTEASPGIVVYARSAEGEAKVEAKISDLLISRSVTDKATNITRNNIFASAKVKNTGNVDFTAIGKMKVSPIIGFSSYETPDNAGRLSVIPEAELVLTDEWTDTPGFGIYSVSWTVSVGDQTESASTVIFLIPIWVLLIIIIVLTFLTIWIIMLVRRRKERRSRLAI